MIRETRLGHGHWPSSTRASPLACEGKAAARYAGCSFAPGGLIDSLTGTAVAAFRSAAHQRCERHQQKRQIEGSIPLGRPVIPSCLRIVVG